MICVLVEFFFYDNGINLLFCINIEFELILYYIECMMFFLSIGGVVFV